MNNTKPRPLSFSLARLTSSVAVASALTLAAQGQVVWEGTSGGTPGDGFLWTNPLNWSPDTLPTEFDDVIFANTASTGPILLNGDKTVNSLQFIANNYTIGAYGTSNVLTNNSALFTVDAGNFATLNASYGGVFGLNLTGGGTLFMNHPSPAFGGDISVTGAGTTLLHRQEGPTIQYNGVGSGQEFGRFDQVTLGLQRSVRNIVLSDGGEYRIINAGNNPETNFKNIIIGGGGGRLNLAAGYILQNLDDTGQIGVTSETFTKAGKGRLIIGGAASLAAGNPLQGIVNIDGGMISLDVIASQVVGTSTAHNRFLGIAGLGATLNINNGGTLMINNGTQAFLDVQTINANNGSIIAVNSQDHIFGYAASPGTAPGVPEFLSTSLNIPGGSTTTLLTRDLFGVQTQRFPRFRNQLDGSGTLEIRGNTNSGGTPRLVIERSAPAATFDGIYRLVENTSLEANPRFNSTAHGGTGTLVNTGKVLAGGDIEFAGWGSTLDVRDSEAVTSLFDYTNNEISITTTQRGSVNTISPVRGDTAAGTGHIFNFGTLTLGSHYLQIGGNNSYQTGFADTASITGNATFRLNSDNSHLIFSNAAAIAEDAAGRSLTIIKAGQGNAAARDVVSAGTIKVSNLDLDFGTLQLRGIDGAIGTGFGGAIPTVTINGGANAGGTNALPSQGLLHLDSNGTNALIVAAGNNNDRIVDSAVVDIRGNGILRLTSESGTGTTETIGATSVFGHGTFDVVKTGAAISPVALTVSTLTLGANATANFTGGATLGTIGSDTARIVIPGTATGILASQFHSGNEWAKYDNTTDNGFELGVTPFLATDYTIDAAADDLAWAPGQQLKLTSATGTVLSADRVVDRLNTQLGAANQVVNLAGFKLTVDQGGILSSTQAMGYKDGATAAVPSGTAGVTAGTTAAATNLYVHANSTIEFHAPIIDNTAGGAVTFVKSGTGLVILSHQDRAVGAAQGTTVFTTPTWSSTHTGGWVVNDGVLQVQRGQFLGATPTTVTLNGGQLEINTPVSNANADTIIPGFGHNIVINGNATVGADDNGEANDASTGDRALIPMGSLTINNNSTMGVGAFSDIDIAYQGGTTINGRATFNVLRNATNANTILGGVVAGSGFDMVGYNAAGGTIVLGGNAADATNNTFNSGLVLYAGTLRLNKANGSVAVPDTADSEDIVINGGAVLWGPGQYGDLVTTNNITTTNNGLVGRAPLSPAPILAAGANQIADSAVITLLAGTLGEGDRITNETFGTLIQKNGTFNVGLGTIAVNSATISGGAVNFDRGSTFSVGTLTMQPGAPDMNVTTGIPAGGAQTTLAIGAGGVSLTGQNIILGTGSSGNVAGSGGILNLGGNVSAVGSDLLGGSYGRKGIFVQLGSSFREIGNSRIDLLGGVRDFNIDTDVIFTVTPQIINGGITKSGGGALILEPYQPSAFTGAITVNAGVLQAKGDGAFGTSAGGVAINSGGTVRLDSGWVYGDSFTVSGPGALVPGGLGVREVGALIAESGYNRLTGAVAISGDTTLAGNTFLDPSVTPGAGGVAYRIGTLAIESAGGITGTGTLTLSGHGDGVIANGINTTGAVIKDGAGRWTISNGSSYAGLTTITAGSLRISNGAALGTTAGGTRIYGGALELTGGISVAEPLTISGDGVSAHSGAIVNVGGTNTLTGAITVIGTTIRSEAGTLNLNGPISGGTASLKLAGGGNGTINGVMAFTAPFGADALTKDGSGTWTWTLAGASGLSGSTTLNGGSLVLAGAGTKLDALSPLNMGGGSISNLGAPQSVNGLNLNAGGSAISGGTGLAVGLITRTPGATVTFAGAGTVSAIGTSNTNGILGGYATVGSDWARVDGSFVVGALSGGAYVNLSTATATDNAIQSTFLPTAGPLVVNSLKIAGGTGIDIGANTLNLDSSGLLYSSSLPGGIGGVGTVSGFDTESELAVHVTGAPLNISAPLIGGGGGLTKAGAGKLILTGASSYSGPISVNGGTLAIVGPGGTTPSAALGASFVARTMTLNGGTFEVAGDYDPGASTMQVAIGSAGGTIRTTFGGQMTLNDAGQFAGSGDLTYTGGGRLRMLAGTPRYTAFTGNVTIDGGIFLVGDPETIGGRQEQTITIKTNSALINGAGFGLGQNGLPNNVVLETGTELYSNGGGRVFSGDMHFGGTHTIALMDRDGLNAERAIFLNGRTYGTGVTLNVYGIVNNTPLYLASGANQLTGTINLNENAVLEVRTPSSSGLNNGDVTVNLNGANSRLLLRHFQNADYKLNVNANTTSEINSDRLVGFGGGANQYLTINNLAVTTPANSILTLGGGNAYTTRVAGTATFNSNTALDVTGGAGILFENGINFAGGADTLDKRGTSSIVLHGAANHTGPTIIQGGFVILQGANGALPNTSAIQLRGGELRVDNSSAVNGNRINDTAPISLGGGALRITGAETIGTITADSGTTQLVFNPVSETVISPVTLTGFTRASGAVVQFQAPDLGTNAVGASNLNSARVASRVIIPGMATTTQTIPGFLGNNNLDFVQYSTTVEGGAELGVRDMRNPGNTASPANYTNDPAEGAWTDAVIARLTGTTTTTLTTNRALDAIKIEGGAARTIALGTNSLRIEGGGILAVGNTSVINGSGTVGLTAGAAAATAGIADLIIGGNNTITINSKVSDNPFSGQTVALIKTGTGTLNLNSLSQGGYTAGTYLHSGTLNTTVNHAFGAPSNPMYLDGGTLTLNVGNAATIGGLGGFGHAVNVRGNALIVADNGALAGVDNDYEFGALSINGPYTLSMRSFDSMDVSFTGTHVLAGMPTFNMAQAGSGGNGTGFFTLSGAITGSGFYVTSTGNVDNVTSVLQIGGGAGDAAPNTFTGKLITLQGTFTEDNVIELNKAPGTAAIPGDIEMNGSTLRTAADNQFGTTNLVLNRGIVNVTATSQTLASITMRGGELVTNPLTGASTANTLTITGGLTVTGLDDMGGALVNGASVTTGFSIGNLSTVNVGGLISIGTFGRIHLSEGQAGSFLNVNGGLEMTGALLSQNSGAGANTVRLSSDVTTLASLHPSQLGNSTDSDTFVDLNGTRTFTIADGTAASDFQLSSVVRNSTGPVAVGALVKNGPGSMQIQGGATANSYTGGTTVNEGSLVLFKSVNVNAIPAGTFTIGDGVGGAGADQVFVRNNNQIADTADVVLAASGLLDFGTFNTSDTIGNLTGAAGSEITLGPTSVLTVASTATTTFSGKLGNNGTLTKAGAGELTLDGDLALWTINADAGILNLDTDGNLAVVNVGATGIATVGSAVGVSTLTSLNIAAGGIFILDETAPVPAGALGEAGAPFTGDAAAAASFGGGEAAAAAADFGGSETAAVPEPGSVALLAFGALGLLGRRRRRA